MERDKSRSSIIIKIDDEFCEWEFGFDLGNFSINDIIVAIETKFGVIRDYEKNTREIGKAEIRAFKSITRN